MSKQSRTPEQKEATRLLRERNLQLKKERIAASKARDKAEAAAAKKKKDILDALDAKTEERGCTAAEAAAAKEKLAEIKAKPEVRIATKFDALLPQNLADLKPKRRR
jgi:hypothetical protein